MNQHSTRWIDPTLENIYVSRHAIDQYQSRAIEDGKYLNTSSIINRIKSVLIKGRRSDRDPSLITELEPWLGLVKWRNKGRPVSLWMDKERLCCLVVKDFNTNSLIVLTCFKAVEKGVKKVQKSHI